MVIKDTRLNQQRNNILDIGGVHRVLLDVVIAVFLAGELDNVGVRVSLL